MDSNIAAALVSGICSIVSAFGAVYLKEYLDRRKSSAVAQAHRERPVSEPSAPTGPPPVEHPVPRAQSVAVPIWRPIVIVAVSFLFGVLTRALRPYMNFGNVHYETLIAFVVIVALVLAFAVVHRRRGFQLAFQLENLALWSGFASGWSLIHGRVWSDLLGVTIPWWLGCCVVGGLVVSFRRKPDAGERAADGMRSQ